MKISTFDNDGWVHEHPRGLAFNYLLSGDDPDSADNFRCTLGRQDVERFQMPRHRHTFDQIRMPLVGDMNVGEQGILRAGEIGYFPEGVTYGPQDDPLGEAKLGERLCLVFQFGGASGRGMAIARRKSGEQLQAPEVQRIKFPRARFRDIIVADPACYNWFQVPGASGVDHKFIGSFTERAVWIEIVRVGVGANWSSMHPGARRLLVVLSGNGEVAGTAIDWMGALQAEAGEELRISAADELHLLLVGLPPVRTPHADTTPYDVVDGHGDVTQFEDVREIQNVLGPAELSYTH